MDQLMDVRCLQLWEKLNVFVRAHAIHLHDTFMSGIETVAPTVMWAPRLCNY